MQQEKQLTKQHDKNEKEMIQVWVTKKRMSRPFPLRWGLAALALFATFAVVTQIQFSRVADEKIYQARLDTFRSDERAYDVALKAHSDCIASIDIRETYRTIFGGVSALFQKTADLPAQLFPGSPATLAYQEELTRDIITLITEPVKEGLPPKEASECPKVPPEPPKRPER